ncbi:hypothetical protein [Ruania halotolerans]|nr:hypothetical protein [Ruania halotolerans]UFU04887.1 hypothetical protein LQF10_10355 [Ruania halotolerans]
MASVRAVLARFSAQAANTWAALAAYSPSVMNLDFTTERTRFTVRS